MNFKEALHLARWQGADIRHPSMDRGYVLRMAPGGKDEAGLRAFNPFNSQPQKRVSLSAEDRERTDWIAGHGIAAL